ncbi:MAG TPA: N-acetyl-gamma-glutamyl-phosphate reductase [Gammaproteobacteria bacterium]|nr:N-acetyl-gamma-glutamyl-phosphate reductase [Gammaproteobacteria bacterium]
MKIGIIGVTGYTGIELLRILNAHPEVEIKCVTTESFAGEMLAQVYPHLKNVINLMGEKLDIEKMAASSCELVFIALPHGHATPIVEKLLAAGKKIIDLGADFRLQNNRDYQQWYQLSPPPAHLLQQAVYGLPEAGMRAAISQAKLVANPGCYATCAALVAIPAIMAGVIAMNDFIFDAKSGVSGAGRSLSLNSHFCETAENFKPYQVAGDHRHTPEIEQTLSKVAGQRLRIQFTPHLVPLVRGLAVTAYFKLLTPLSEQYMQDIYHSKYQKEPFLRVFSDAALPQSKNVAGSNFCDIAVRVDTRTQRLIVLGAIDNLVKGAAGQAVQNMNLMCGFKETLGLDNLQIRYP